MLNQLFIEIWASAHGKKLSKLLADITGVSTKTLNKPPYTGLTIKKIENRGLTYSKRQLQALDYSNEEIDKLISNAPKEGVCSSLIYWSQIDGLVAYPHALEFAKEIDALSAHLLELRTNNDLNGFKSTILGSVVGKPIYFATDPSSFEPNASNAYYDSLNSAKEWNELDEPYKSLVANTSLSLLARWDVEFGSQWFGKLEHRPIFALTHLKLNPATGGIVDGKIKTKRDWLWSPVRRLIDFMACLGERFQKNRWPEFIPDVVDIAARTNIDEDKIENWRRLKNPHRFTHKNFIDLWNKLCPDKPAPFPLFFATLLWQKLSIHDERQFLIIDNEYLSWWQWHYDDLKAKGCAFGTTPWPACFNKL